LPFRIFLTSRTVQCPAHYVYPQHARIPLQLKYCLPNSTMHAKFTKFLTKNILPFILMGKQTLTVLEQPSRAPKFSFPSLHWAIKLHQSVWVSEIPSKGHHMFKLKTGGLKLTKFWPVLQERRGTAPPLPN
jgi:hypothetical protein